MLPYICDRWAGPMVVAALLPPAPPALQPPDALRASLPWPSSLGLNGSAPRCIASLLELTPPHNTSHPPGAYPINWLRNQAISCARTSHYLIADIDFWPSFELLPLLRRQLPPWGDKQKALVIPAFQRSGHGCRAKSESACREALVKAEMKVPGNFAELSACAKERLCSAFDSEYNSAGQASTNVNAWRGLTAGAKMPIRCDAASAWTPEKGITLCIPISRLQPGCDAASAWTPEKGITLCIPISRLQPVPHLRRSSPPAPAPFHV
jgi:hypothetical protein